MPEAFHFRVFSKCLDMFPRFYYMHAMQAAVVLTIFPKNENHFSNLYLLVFVKRMKTKTAAHQPGKILFKMLQFVRMIKCYYCLSS